MPECSNDNLMNNGKVDPPSLEISSLFNAYDLARYNKLADFVVGEIFRRIVGERGITVSDLTKPSILGDMFRGVQAYMTNMLVQKASDNVTDSMWKQLSPKAIDDIDKIVENFDVFLKNYVKYNNIVNTSEFNFLEDNPQDDELDTDAESKDDEHVDETEEVDNKGKEYDKVGNEDSQFDLATPAIRIIFRLTPRAVYNPETKQSDVWLDGDGLPQPCNMSATWNLLADKVAGEKDSTRFKDLLTSDKLKQVIPEVQFINEMIKTEKREIDMTTSETNQFTQFHQRFMKSKVPIKSTYMGEDGGFALRDEIRGNALKIEGTYNNNFISGNIPEDYKKYTKRTASGVYFLQKSESKEYLPPTPNSFDEKLKFLNFLGIQFTGTPYLSPTEQETFKTMVDETATRLYNSLVNRLADGETQITEPISQLRRRQGRLIPPEAESINRIIAFESIWSKIVPTHSSRNVMGELQHLIINDNALTMANYYLNRAETLDELTTFPAFANIKYNPQFKTSYLIKYLFDEKGNKRKGRSINLELLSGIKTEQDSKTRSRIERQLSNSQKLLHDYNNFLVYGRTDTMRTETSHSFYMLSMAEEGKGPRTYLTPKGFTQSFFENRDFRNQILDYLNGELARIASYDEKAKENAFLPKAYGDFAIFSELFEDGKNEELKKALLDAKEIEFDSPVFTQFAIEYERLMDGELSDFKKLLNKYQISENQLLGKQLRDMRDKGLPVDALHRAFIAGTLLQNIEFGILYAGDSLFYKDAHKRFKGLSSTGNIAVDSSLLRSYFTTVEARTFDDKYSLFAANNKNRLDNTNVFRTQVLSEYKLTPWNTKTKKGFAYLDPELPAAIQESVRMRDGDIGMYTTDYINKLLSKANKVDPADGQGYINLDFHRELSFRFGFSTPETEVAYKYEGLIYRRDIQGKKLSDDQQRELQQFESMIYADPQKYGLPVIKMTYWGNIRNSTVDGKAFDKFSVAPILPSHARNHKGMAKIMNDMVAGQYGYVKYESGTKAFKRAVVDDLQGAEPDEYFTPLLKEQIKTDPNQSVDTSIPTQMLKLIFANLFSGGRPKTANIGKVYDRYIGALSDIQKEQVNRTLGDLGVKFNEEDGKVNIESVDFSKLSNKLIREAKNQQMNSNVISSLQIDPKTGNFRIAPEATGFQKQINDLIAGILDRNLRRFKFPGGNFVLISNANHDALPWYKFSKDGTEAAGCRITLTKEYTKLLNKIHPDGEKIGTIERLNKLLKNKEWRKENEQSLLVILDRVPTQGHNSMDFAMVHEFLSPTMGNVVILPEEIVYKSGTDFDYDKEKVISPNFDANGNYLTKNPEARLKEVTSKLNELQDIYPDLVKLANQEIDNDQDYSSFLINNIFNTSAQAELFRANKEADALLQEYYSLKGDVSALKSNSIMEIYKDVLSSPETFVELISPNTTLSIRDISDKNSDNTNNHLMLPQLGKVYSYMQNLNVFRSFFDAKGLLAAFAVDNTFQQLLTYSGIDIADHFMVQKSGQYVPQMINNLLLSADEYSKINANNRIKTSLREDIDNFIKQHWNSENINATVDAAKDPFFATLRIVWENIGVVNLLKNFGVPFERIVDYINNPTMQYYFSLIQSGHTRKSALEKVARERLSLVRNIENEKQISRDTYSLLGYMSDSELRDKKVLKQNEMVPVDPNTGRRKIAKRGNEFYATISESTYPIAKVVKEILAQVDNGVPVNIQGYERINKWINDKPITPERLKWLARPENDRQVVKNDKDRKGENLGIYSDDIRLLAHFVQLENLSYAFRNFQKYYNFDTAKTATSIDVRLKEKLRRKMDEEKLFSREDLDKMSTHSILSPYINNNMIRNIYDKMFPILGKKVVQNYLSALYENYDSPFRAAIRNKRDLRNMPKVLSQDFLTSVVFTYGNYKGANLFYKGFNLLVRKETGTVMNQGIEVSKTFSTTMVDRLVKFRQQPFYKEIVSEFPVLDRLISNKFYVNDANDLNALQHPGLKLDQPFELENVQLIKNPNETLLEQEEIIEQFRDMYYGYKYDKGTDQQNERINEALHSFLEDLFITGIVQSGFAKTNIGYAEYIPVEFTRDIYTKALDNFNKLDKDNADLYMKYFYVQFMNNNPKYFPNYRLTDPFSGKKNFYSNNNKYSNRVKIYNIPVKPEGFTMVENSPKDLPPSGTEPSTPTPPPTTPPSSPINPTGETKAPKMITEVTRDTKKESYTITLGDGKEEERQGYRLHVKEYPKFEAYITGSSKDGWTVDEITTSKRITVTGNTIKDTLPELVTILNNAFQKPEFRSTLAAINLFTEDDEEDQEDSPPNIELESGQNVQLTCQ